MSLILKLCRYILIAIFLSHAHSAEPPKTIVSPGGTVQGLSKFKILVSCQVEFLRIKKTDKEIADEKAAGTFKGVVKVVKNETCTPHKFCEIGKWGNILDFSSKAVEIHSPGSSPILANYFLEKNNIVVQTSPNTQQEFAIRAWDNNFDVKEFTIDGRRFVQDICMKSTQDKMQLEEFESQRIAKEKLEAEKNETLRLENEIKEREKLQLEIQAKYKELSDSIEKVRLDLLQIQNEKLSLELKKQQAIEDEKIKNDLLEKEKMQKVKTKIKSF